jgi:hypothetical protein
MSIVVVREIQCALLLRDIFSLEKSMMVDNTVDGIMMLSSTRTGYYQCCLAGIV